MRAGDISRSMIFSFFSMISSLTTSGEEPRRDRRLDRDRADFAPDRTDKASQSRTDLGASESGTVLITSSLSFSIFTSLTDLASDGASIKRVVVASIVSTVSPARSEAGLLSRAKYSLDLVKTSSIFSGPRAFSMSMVFSSYITSARTVKSPDRQTYLFIVRVS